jgi:hypothetical protein
MFNSKAGAYLNEAPFVCPTLRLLALPTNIRLGKKGLPETSTLAYHDNSYIATVKSYVTFCPGVVS